MRPIIENNPSETADVSPENTFCERIYAVVKRIPKGTVASYGQVALLAGYPGAARAVGNALHKNPDPGHIPCYRVVHASGKLSEAFVFGGIQFQKELLEGDGIPVLSSGVDMHRYQWKTSGAE